MNFLDWFTGTIFDCYHIFMMTIFSTILLPGAGDCGREVYWRSVMFVTHYEVNILLCLRALDTMVISIVPYLHRDRFCTADTEGVCACCGGIVGPRAGDGLFSGVPSPGIKEGFSPCNLLLFFFSVLCASSKDRKLKVPRSRRRAYCIAQCRVNLMRRHEATPAQFLIATNVCTTISSFQ